MMPRTLWCIAAGVLMVVASSASAFTYVFPIDGLQEVPPVATPGFGSGTVMLVDTSPAPDDWMLSWTISYSGLIGTPTLAHFHGAAPPGVSAGVKVDIAALSGGVASPMVGSTMITDAGAGEVIGGLWYVNIHSTFKPGGEIRGQVVPEPTALALLGLGGLSLIRRRRLG